MIVPNEHPTVDIHIMDCCICLDKKAIVTLRPCKHECLCVRCLLTTKAGNSNIYCPICRAEVKWYDSTASINDCLECMFRDDELIFKALESYFGNLSSGAIDNTDEIKKTVYDVFEAICNLNKESYPLLTVEHTNSLLKLCVEKHIHTLHKNYILKNILVSMCKQPWDVDGALGTHGVCYHGNMGDKPSLKEGIALIQSNYKIIKERRHF